MLTVISSGNRLVRTIIIKTIKTRYFQSCGCMCVLKQRTSFPVNVSYSIVHGINNRIYNTVNHTLKYLFSTTESQSGTLSKNEFELTCNETLDSLCDYFEEIVENCGHLKGGDVTYSDGVLTVHFGNDYGTYVINRQTPNHQIWLSSPTSGPKRYDFITSRNSWIYRHNDKSLHNLLQEEIPKIVKSKVNFFNCAHSG